MEHKKNTYEDKHSTYEYWPMNNNHPYDYENRTAADSRETWISTKSQRACEHNSKP